MATHSSTLAWKISWTGEPGGLQSLGSQRVRHDWVTSLHSLHSLHTLLLEKEMAIHSSILVWRIPWTEEPGGPWSMGSQRVRHEWSDWAWAYLYIHSHTHRGFPHGSEGKHSACNARNLASIPGSGRSPGGGHGYPLQYCCLENPMDRRAWWVTVRGVTKSWIRLRN